MYKMYIFTKEDTIKTDSLVHVTEKRFTSTSQLMTELEKLEPGLTFQILKEPETRDYPEYLTISEVSRLFEVPTNFVEKSCESREIIAYKPNITSPYRIQSEQFLHHPFFKKIFEFKNALIGESNKKIYESIKDLSNHKAYHESIQDIDKSREKERSGHDE